MQPQRLEKAQTLNHGEGSRGGQVTVSSPRSTDVARCMNGHSMSKSGSLNWKANVRMCSTNEIEPLVHLSF